MPPARYPEITLSAPLGEHRLIAKFDLIAIEPGGAGRDRGLEDLGQAPQAGLADPAAPDARYRDPLVRAAWPWNHGQPLRPEQIEMIYWFANFPDEPERLRYDATQFEADGRYLMEMAAKITQREDEVFPLTDDLRRCLFCVVPLAVPPRVEAGDLDAADTDTATDEVRVARLGRQASTSNRSGRSHFERHHRQRRADVT